MTVFYLLSFVLGTCAGSFVQCVTERRLKGLPIGGRSRCDSCGAVFHWYDLLPILSWFMLKGRCRYCGADIPKTSLLVEVLMGSMYGLVGYVYGLSFYTVFLWTVCAVVVSLSIEDIHQYTIHDGYHVCLILIRAFYAVINRERVFILFAGEALVVLLFIFFLAKAMQFLLHKVCLGMGDVKLLGCIGLFAGIEGTMLVCFLASFAALVTAGILKENKIPFGPFLGGALFVVLTACGGMVYCIH